MNKERWFQELYEANYERIFRVASNLLYQYAGRTEDVQDVVQEVFLLAARMDISGHPKPAAWLVSTAKNICSNFRRTENRVERRRSKAASETLKKCAYRQGGYIEPSEDDTQLTDLNLSIAQSLTSEEWILISSYCIEGRSAEELALEMGVSPGTIYTRIFRIRKKIKDLI